MKPLSYPPLLAAVYALQSLTAVTVALSRFSDARAVVAFSVVFTALYGAALAFAARVVRRGRAAGKLAQLLQIAAVAAVALAWYRYVGLWALPTVTGLMLVAVCNAFLVDRRALYFDLAIVLTLFYDGIGSLPERFAAYQLPLAIVFLAVLVFVLMADYTDRRLEYVHVGDTRELTAPRTGIENAALATAAVLAVSALIYLLLPQPQALQVGIFPDRGPPLQWGPPSGGERGPPTGQQAGGDARRKSAGGKPGGGKSGAGKSGQEPRDGKSAGGDSSAGNSDGGATGAGRGRMQPAGPGHEPGWKPDPERPGDFPGGRHPSRNANAGGAPPVPDKLDLADSAAPGGDRNDDKAAGNKREGQDDQGKRSDKPKAGNSEKEDDSQKSKEKKKKGAAENQELVLFFMDADRPLYLRTHVFARQEPDGWIEQPLQFASSSRGVYRRRGVPNEGVEQRYKVAQQLDERMAAAFSRVYVGIRQPTVRWNRDEVLAAMQPLEKDTEYRVTSTLQYLGDRASALPEADPPEEYRFFTTTGAVVTLARDIAERAGSRSAAAAALERYVRENHRPGRFEMREGAAGDPVYEFLFEAKRGSSRHFAGALAVMLRAAGIPSRIVAGYRARRLNPLHGTYEVWPQDRHYWVEAFIEVGWVTYEPSPWAALPPQSKPATAFAAAREYARLAQEPSYEFSDGGGSASTPQPNVPSWYLYLVLAWGWLATFGKLAVLVLIALGVAAWRWRWWSRPLRDAWDRFRLRQRPGGEPSAAVRARYFTIERLCARRNLRRGLTENHVEFLDRVARARPHLASACSALAAEFSAARYGGRLSTLSVDRAWSASRTIANLIDEKL